MLNNKSSIAPKPSKGAYARARHGSQEVIQTGMMISNSAVTTRAKQDKAYGQVRIRKILTRWREVSALLKGEREAYLTQRAKD